MSTTSDQHQKRGNLADFTVPYRKPYPFAQLLQFISRRALPGVESVANDAYRRTVMGGGRSCILEVRDDPERVRLECRLIDAANDHDASITSAPPDRAELLEGVRHLFDTELDAADLARGFDRDPLMSRLYAAFGPCRLAGAYDPYEVCIRAIVGQQVSVKAATTVMGRIVIEYGTSLPGADPAGELAHHFPLPQTLSAIDASRVGLTARRAATIRLFSDWYLETGGIVRGNERVRAEQLIEDLCGLNGIGPWTANYMAMRAMGWSDAWLSGDLVLRRALSALLPQYDGASARQLDEFSERWRPYRAYALALLWAST